MGIAEIIALLAALTDAGMKIAARIKEAMALFAKMNAEGRDKLTDEEVTKMVAIRDAARKALADEIAKS